MHLNQVAVSAILLSVAAPAVLAGPVTTKSHTAKSVKSETHHTSALKPQHVTSHKPHTTEKCTKSRHTSSKHHSSTSKHHSSEPEHSKRDVASGPAPTSSSSKTRSTSFEVTLTPTPTVTQSSRRGKESPKPSKSSRTVRRETSRKSDGHRQSTSTRTKQLETPKAKPSETPKSKSSKSLKSKPSETSKPHNGPAPSQVPPFTNGTMPSHNGTQPHNGTEHCNGTAHPDVKRFHLLATGKGRNHTALEHSSTGEGFGVSHPAAAAVYTYCEETKRLLVNGLSLALDTVSHRVVARNVSSRDSAVPNVLVCSLAPETKKPSTSGTHGKPTTKHSSRRSEATSTTRMATVTVTPTPTPAPNKGGNGHGNSGKSGPRDAEAEADASQGSGEMGDEHKQNGEEHQSDDGPKKSGNESGKKGSDPKKAEALTFKVSCSVSGGKKGGFTVSSLNNGKSFLQFGNAGEAVEVEAVVI